MRFLAQLFILVLFAAPAVVAADTDLHITADGAVTAMGLTVYQKAKTNFFSRATWGNAFIRMVVLTTSSTTVTRSHGEAGSVDDIKNNDVLDVTGRMNVGGDSITITASEIRDSAITNAPKTLTGVVKSIDMQDDSFVLTNKTFGTTIVRPRGDVTFTKGVRTISLGDLTVGDKVIAVTGDYEYSSGTLTASSISIYQDKSIFAARNFEGTLKSVASTQLPTTVVVTVGSQDYTVALTKNAAIMSSNKKPSSLTRFVVGDTVRFFGKIRETDFSQVDAEALRDLNF